MPTIGSSEGASSPEERKVSQPPDSDTLSRFLTETGLTRSQLEKLVHDNVETVETPSEPVRNLGIANPPRLPRLGIFSGKEPVKQGEVDWETFYDVAMEIASMANIDERSKRREIITRLVLPAKDFAKQVSSDATALTLLSFLDSIYGTVENNNLLLQEFMGMVQERSEKPSDFLKRLQLKVSRLVEIHEFSPETASQKLLDKLKMGCHDEHILRVTNLHYQMVVPRFPKLIGIIREVEATRDAKLA